MDNIKNYILQNVKNIPGWRTKRKLLVISVDDYGNVRVDSQKAVERMRNAGLEMNTRFDKYDTLETREDLEQLLDVLTSVKDENGRYAVFTPFALPCNIDFEKIAEEGYNDYCYEQLPVTFEKLAALQTKAYEGTWEVWKNAIKEKIILPQFHGREHLNIQEFLKKLRNKENDIMISLKNRSFAGLKIENPLVHPYAAFDFQHFSENEKLKEIIADGLNAFENVFGFRSESFNAPRGTEHSVLHETLLQSGVKFLDGKLFRKIHQGNGRFKPSFHYTGKKSNVGQIYIVKNCVFEPTDDRGFDWVEYCLKQVEAAFRWGKPAIISSHRVNFCGHIDLKNRQKGLSSLRKLLKKIVAKWPDVEFISNQELGKFMMNDFKK